MNESINGSGFNKDYGLYGSNLMSGGRLKLMPRNCQEFVEEIQAEIEQKYGKKVEVFVYGDGAFKDPVGGIWELADPTTTLGATSEPAAASKYAFFSKPNILATMLVGNLRKPVL